MCSYFIWMYRVTYIGCANGVVTRSATEKATAMEATGPAMVPLELSLRQPTQKKISNFRPISTTVDLDSANFKIGQTTHVHSLKKKPWLSFADSIVSKQVIYTEESNMEISRMIHSAFSS